MLRLAIRTVLVLLIAGSALLLLRGNGGPQLIHSEDSQFGKLLVFEENGERCMNFNSMHDVGRQTCMSLEHPGQLVFSYTRMMMTALYINPKPRNILIVGLGGATLQKTLAALLPDTVIDTVEIDPAVGKVAARYFGYQQGPRQRLYLEDGRAYIERAHREGLQYDMVMLDAFDVDYIPEHLMTLEFLQHVRGILAPGGVAVANTFTESQLYARESATYAAVFGAFFNLQTGNRVIMAVNGELPGRDELARNAAALDASLGPLGVDLKEALGLFSRREDIADDAPVLRD
ncbi:spermine/spermidine synthase family protein 2 [Achromobacter xylosoxidans A8]|uniref:Spermine/spermidine synthase family protein 2 n=1 Tax=Achromobacter xylosoxidans (strain A8) TaxID=762376 RepID=E3HJY5_ACHXA|nr:fused MFS/spermidine synthase [Achromobacter xylosoxidans]ADP15607.1 spermine/spermidine synthase family protein 2 [Achromobacter xylosoxidans A8]